MEEFNDEAPVTIRICGYGQRHIGTQLFVKREPRYGVLGFTEALGIAEERWKTSSEGCRCQRAHSIN